MNPYQVVIWGRKIGIFNDWKQAWSQVNGYKRNLYQTFATLELAERWWTENTPLGTKPVYHFEIAPQLNTDESEGKGPFYTYIIIDPRDGQPFYVGQTVNMDQRKHRHLREEMGIRGKRPYKQVIKAILSEGLQPEFREVDQQPTLVKSRQSETEWIKRLAAQGTKVLNARREHREWIRFLSTKKTRAECEWPGKTSHKHSDR